MRIRNERRLFENKIIRFFFFFFSKFKIERNKFFTHIMENFMETLFCIELKWRFDIVISGFLKAIKIMNFYENT